MSFSNKQNIFQYVGTKFFGHDSAVCVLDTKTETIFCTSTERVTRFKHDPYDVSPVLKNLTLDQFKISHSFNAFNNLDTAYENKALGVISCIKHKIRRRIIKPKFINDFYKVSRNEFYKMLIKKPILSFNYFILAILSVILEKIYMPSFINKLTLLLFIKIELLFITKRWISSKNIDFFEHHKCHAISSIYSSEFNLNENIIAITLDGWGDGFFSKIYSWNKGEIELLSGSVSTVILVDNKNYNLSIGNIYSSYTKILGFHPGSDEGKVEALAAFGTPDDLLLRELLENSPVKKGVIHLNSNYFLKHLSTKNLLSLRESLTDENLASTIQTYLEEIFKKLVSSIFEYNQIKSNTPVCLSGGVCANVIMTHKARKDAILSNYHVIPAMGDEGTAIGAAILQAIQDGVDLRWVQNKLKMPYLGSEVNTENIDETVRKYNNIKLEKPDNLVDSIYEQLVKNKIIGVVQGTAEFGPRALGNRSILAMANNSKIRDKINLHIKSRHAFQPLCPMLIVDQMHDLLEDPFEHLHMATAFKGTKFLIESNPSAVHVDGTARPQIVTPESNPLIYSVLTKILNEYGFGVLLNTSFNKHGRTMIETIDDAIVDFIDCNLDALYVNDYLITKKDT